MREEEEEEIQHCHRHRYRHCIGVIVIELVIDDVFEQEREKKDRRIDWKAERVTQ